VTPDDAAATWCAVTPTTGTNDDIFSVTVVANTGAQRTTTITVKTNDNAIIRTFTVAQAAAPAGLELEVNPAALSFVVDGESKTFTITSNTAWTITPDEAASWYTVTPSLTGSNNGTITVTAAANTSAARSATITVSGTGVADKEIGVTQAGAGGDNGSSTFSAAWDFSSITTGVSAVNNSPCTISPAITGSVEIVENLTQSGFGNPSSPAAKSWGGSEFNTNTAANIETTNIYATVKIKSTSKSLSLSTLSGNIRRSGTGPTNTAIFYKLGDGAFVAGPDIANTSGSGRSGSTISPVDLSEIAALQTIPAGTVITVKFVPHTASGATGTWYLNSGGTPTTALKIEGVEQ
jgi:hypothetical protein